MSQTLLLKNYPDQNWCFGLCELLNIITKQQLGSKLLTIFASSNLNFRSHGRMQFWTQNQHSQVALFSQTNLWFSPKSHGCSLYQDAFSRKEKFLLHSKHRPSPSLHSRTWASNTQESKNISAEKAQVPCGLAFCDTTELPLPSQDSEDAVQPDKTWLTQLHFYLATTR